MGEIQIERCPEISINFSGQSSPPEILFFHSAIRANLQDVIEVLENIDENPKQEPESNAEIRLNLRNLLATCRNGRQLDFDQATRGEITNDEDHRTLLQQLDGIKNECAQGEDLQRQAAARALIIYANRYRIFVEQNQE